MEKKGCFKCEKGAGIFTCNGCQQSFCRKHSEEHRTELATQMDFIGQEYDLFRRDMDAANGEGTLLVQIDVWEQESIFRIKQAAESARRDLRSMASGRVKLELKSSMDQMSKEIQSSRESEDYMEGDLVQWINQLNQCRKELEELESLSLIDDGNESAIIRLIKVHETECFRASKKNSRVSSVAQFTTAQECSTSFEDGLVFVASGLQRWKRMAFVGTRSYANGSRSVGFRIEKLTAGAVLFGIIPFSHADRTSIFTSPNGVYGWYAGSVSVKNNAFQEEDIQKSISATVIISPWHWIVTVKKSFFAIIERNACCDFMSILSTVHYHGRSLLYSTTMAIVCVFSSDLMHGMNLKIATDCWGLFMSILDRSTFIFRGNKQKKPPMGEYSYSNWNRIKRTERMC